MARFTGMVRISNWQKIGLAALVLALCVLYLWRPDTAVSVYVASDEASDLAIVDGIARADRSATSSPAMIRGVVVPHHLVASEAVALGIKALVYSRPRLIVLVSPDHFERCPTLVCSTRGSYKTFFGDLEIDTEAAKKVLAHAQIAAESDLFAKEHGIYAIVPFIKHYLPQTVIVPIVISQKGVGAPESRKELLDLVQDLLEERDTALVISSDFSHYLPLNESDAMDKKTESAFCAGESEQILALDNPDQSDCPICLWLLREAAAAKGFWNPGQIWHSNSATILHDQSVQETTSHFVFTLGEFESKNSCTVANF